MPSRFTKLVIYKFVIWYRVKVLNSRMKNVWFFLETVTNYSVTGVDNHLNHLTIFRLSLSILADGQGTSTTRIVI